MRWPRALAVREACDLHAVDPARAWTVVGDLRRLPEWTTAESVQGEPEAPAMGDEFAAVHRFGPMRYRVEYEVRSWEPGRRFRLGVAGWPLAEAAELRVAVEAMVEPDGAWSRVELLRTATVPAPAGPLAVALARRGVRRSLRRIARLTA